MERVLIIERGDDGRRLGTTLRRAGYDVVETGGTGKGWPGLYYLRDESFHLVIINESISTTDGVELLPSLRHLTNAPIIITGSGAEDSIVQALIQGADAYLPQSVEGETVVAYIQALLRRCSTLAITG
ncbi:MAG: response regulator transcription factor [Dehalococcoidia bacterium]